MFWTVCFVLMLVGACFLPTSPDCCALQELHLEDDIAGGDAAA